MAYKFIKQKNETYKLVKISNAEAEKLYKKSKTGDIVLVHIRKGVRLWTG